MAVTLFGVVTAVVEGVFRRGPLSLTAACRAQYGSPGLQAGASPPRPQCPERPGIGTGTFFLRAECEPQAALFYAFSFLFLSILFKESLH